MTIEQVLESSADELEKLTGEELEKICSAYYNVTRPERVSVKRQSTGQIPMDYATSKKIESLKAIGIDLDWLKKKKK